MRCLDFEKLGNLWQSSYDGEFNKQPKITNNILGIYLKVKTKFQLLLAIDKLIRKRKWEDIPV